jgi:hypothetical protein
VHNRPKLSFVLKTDSLSNESLSRPSSDEVQKQSAYRVGNVPSKYGKPAVGIFGKVGLAETVPGVRNGIGQGRNGIDDLLWEGALCLKFLGDVILHYSAKLDEVVDVDLVWDMPAHVSLVEPLQARVGQGGCSVELMCINRMVDVRKTFVKFLRVPKVVWNDGRWYGRPSTKHDGSNNLNFLLSMRLKLVNEEAEELKLLLLL